jgi:DNA-binding NtrC family response regulator
MDRTVDDRGDREEGPSSGGSEVALVLALEGYRPWVPGARYSLDGITDVTLGRAEARGAEREGATLRIGVPSPALSKVHARIVRRGDAFFVSDAGSRNGTYLDAEPISEAKLDVGRAIEAGRTFFLLHRGPARRPADLDGQAAAAARRGLRTLRLDVDAQNEALLRVAASRVPVLLRGPTGSGKELVARAIHAESRRAGAFVAVNSGALPSTLVEAVLFGHVKGAFSGAIRDEPGYIRDAHNGTLFLDEIGDLPLASQAALLRVLQEGEVTPVGSTRSIPVDVRILAATHRPIEELAEKGEFRADLLARLRGYVHPLRPLAERREDLGLLIAELLAELAPGRRPVLSAKVARALFTYPFPHNIRELAQMLGAAAVLAPDGTELETAHFPPGLFTSVARGAPVRSPPALSEEDAALREELVCQLETHRGNVTHVAEAMGRAPMQVYRWLRRFGLSPQAFRRG